MIYFEWSSQKSTSNKKKHGITFEEAQTVFRDPNARLIDDPDHSESEERFILLGLSENLRTLVVCHCYKENDSVVRIISARKATKIESRKYEENLR